MEYLEGKEESFCLISTLDYTQEEAVRLAGEDSNLIIRGYKKSGKKETIVNIISNSLYKGRRVLLISKNSDALRDINQRLNYINENIFLLSNNSMDLDVFYKNTSELLDNIPKNTGKTTLSKIKVLSRDIDKKIEMLNKINELFYTIRYTGLNLIDMYKITGSKLRISDDIYKYYKMYIIKKPFVNYKYDELMNSIETLLNEKDINKYVKYRRFKNNKLFSKFNNNIPKNTITNSLYRINSLLNNPMSFELPLYNSEYTEDFISSYLINNKITFDDIKTLAKTVNLKYNSYIFDDDYIFKKWNPIYWIKRKSIIKSAEIKKTLLDSIEEKIYLEFLDNLENLNIFIKAFDFIKDIVTEEEYINFIKTLLINDNIIDYFKTLSNALSIYESFGGITEDVASFNTIERDILNYCYNNIERKEEMRNLLSAIPTLYLLHSIEEIETRESEILHYYKNFEIILKDIQLSINTKISFVPSGIRYIWNNKISDYLMKNTINSPNIVDYLNTNKSNLEINDFLALFKSIIFDIYPCFILNYSNVDILPNIKGLFDIVIFYDVGNIDKMDITSNLYTDNKHIVIDDYSETEENNSLLDTYLNKYHTAKLQYDYSDLNYSFEEEINFKSYLQKELFESFSKLGYKIKLNVIISGYDVNLMFYDDNYNNPILALECDDIIYNADYNVRKIDIYRRKYLEDHEVNIVRVWSRDWWLNKKSEIKRIQSILEHLILN